MKKHHPDLFSGDLFDSDKPMAEILKARPDGLLEDRQGNIYDRNGILIREKPSEELLRALERNPDRRPNDPAVQNEIARNRKHQIKNKLYKH